MNGKIYLQIATKNFAKRQKSTLLEKHKLAAFKEGLFQTNASVEVIIPSSVKSISPLPFLFNPPAQIILTFLGDAPTIVEEKDVSWLEDATVRYDPKTTGWDSFAWKDKCEMQALSQN